MVHPDVNFFPARLQAVRQRIAEAEQRFGRLPGSVTLLAVSKTWPTYAIRAALGAGQTRFGESYVQEALPKIEALQGEGAEWHFIGPIQSNKTKNITTYFSWVHSVDRLSIAQRLSTQRPPALPPLNVCLQINVGGELQKAGVDVADWPTLQRLAHTVAELPQLRLRGLMAIPPPLYEIAQQRRAFRVLREMLERLNTDGLRLDTLSMGMSGDLEAAIAEGATMVRIGSAIFGERVV